VRVAHVVTYDAPDGSYGGPTKVAMEQAAALSRAGHEVTVFAGAPQRRVSVDATQGFELRRYPAKRSVPMASFASMRAPALIRDLRHLVHEFDIVHIHFARDLVALAASRVVRGSRVPYVLQTHGMIDRSSRLLARLIDRIETTRALRAARVTLVLTDDEEREIRAHAAADSVRRIRNGVAIAPLPPYCDRRKRVLFLARLQSRKRPREFVQMASLLATRLSDWEFLLIGPDEGEAEAVKREIQRSPHRDRIRWIGPVAPQLAAREMQESSIYVLPSRGEVFPMSVLEAMQAGTPCVVTDSLGIAARCKEYGAAIVTDGSVATMADAVEAIAQNPVLAESLRVGGARYLQSESDIDAVASDLSRHYAEAVRGR